MSAAATIRGLLEPQTDAELTMAAVLELTGADLLESLVDGMHRTFGPGVRTRVTPEHAFPNGDGWITGATITMVNRSAGRLAHVIIGIGHVSVIEGGACDSFELAMDAHRQITKSPLLVSASSS